MICKKSAREILNDEEIKATLKKCFKKCALERLQLRKCVINALNSGLTKENVLKIAYNMVTKFSQDEASLCAIIVIGQTIKYKKNSIGINLLPIKRKELENKLIACFKKCSLARKQLRKCVTNVLDAGFSKEEVLAISDDIVGGFGKNEVSICAIIAVDQVLRYEMNARADPIDIIKERELEREGR